MGVFVLLLLLFCFVLFVCLFVFVFVFVFCSFCFCFVCFCVCGFFGFVCLYCLFVCLFFFGGGVAIDVVANVERNCNGCPHRAPVSVADYCAFALCLPSTNCCAHSNNNDDMFVSDADDPTARGVSFISSCPYLINFLCVRFESNGCRVISSLSVVLLL